MVKSLFNTLAFLAVLGLTQVTAAAPMKESSSAVNNAAILDDLPFVDELTSILSNGDNEQSEEELNQLLSEIDPSSVLEVLDELPIDGIVSELPGFSKDNLDLTAGDPVEDITAIVQESGHLVEATVLTTLDILQAILDPLTGDE